MQTSPKGSFFVSPPGIKREIGTNCFLTWQILITYTHTPKKLILSILIPHRSLGDDT